MIITLKETKEYLKIEHNDEDNLIEMLIKQAEFYIDDGVKNVAEMSPKQLEKSKILALVLIYDWYENRTNTENTNVKIKHTINSIINQIKWEQ